MASAPFTWRGIYELETVYVPGDVVYFMDDGFTYVCVKESISNPPYLENSGFELLAGFNVIYLDGGGF
jgi:hypothetical protein